MAVQAERASGAMACSRPCWATLPTGNPPPPSPPTVPDNSLVIRLSHPSILSFQLSFVPHPSPNLCHHDNPATPPRRMRFPNETACRHRCRRCRHLHLPGSRADPQLRHPCVHAPPPSRTPSPSWASQATTPRSGRVSPWTQVGTCQSTVPPMLRSRATCRSSHSQSPGPRSRLLTSACTPARTWLGHCQILGPPSLVSPCSPCLTLSSQDLCRVHGPRSRV